MKGDGSKDSMVRIVPFTGDHIPAAAELVAGRHGAIRATEPSLPERFEDPAECRPKVQELLDRAGSIGAAAVGGDRLVAFLLTVPRIEELWGRSVWAHLAGHAVDLRTPGGTAWYEDLYAALAGHWVARGCFLHYVMVPAVDDATLARWFGLGFGQVQCHAVRELIVDQRGADDPSLEVRRVTIEDHEAVAAVAGVLHPHHADPPVFAVALPERMDELARSHRDDMAAGEGDYWLAYRDGRPVGMQIFYPAEEDLMVPADSVELGRAETLPQEQGRGVGSALTARGLLAAREAGARFCITDWRTANFTSGRFWLHRGFRPMVYRLHRAIDPRVAWGTGRRTAPTGSR